MKTRMLITQGAPVKELLELLRGRQSLKQVAGALVAGVADGSLILSGYITQERLTGNGPFPVAQQRLGLGKKLGGRLRRALAFTKPRYSAGRLTTTVSSRVKYWPRHEFGFAGREQVQSHRVKKRKVGARLMPEAQIPTSNIKAAKISAHTVAERTVENAFGRGQAVTIPAHIRKAYLRREYTRKAYTRKAFTMKAHTIPAHTRAAFTRRVNVPARQPVQAGIKEHAVRVYGASIEKHLRRALELKQL
jgi:hypothetical protein